MNDAQTKHPQAAIESWLAHAPEWAKHAYYNDATFNRQLTECTYHNIGTDAMLWRLAGMLYEQRNYWRETYMESRKRDTHTIKL